MGSYDSQLVMSYLGSTQETGFFESAAVTNVLSVSKQHRPQPIQATQSNGNQYFNEVQDKIARLHQFEAFSSLQANRSSDENLSKEESQAYQTATTFFTPYLDQHIAQTNLYTAMRRRITDDLA